MEKHNLVPKPVQTSTTGVSVGFVATPGEELLDRIRKLLAEKGPLDSLEIAEALNADLLVVWSACGMLVDCGKIRKVYAAASQD